MENLGLYGAIFIASGFLLSALLLPGLWGSITSLIFLMAGTLIVVLRLTRD